jgi:hypothetical protein
MAMVKSAYICGPLTELPPDQKGQAKAFYEAVGALASRITGTEAFVPHKHYDPVVHANFTPPEVYGAESEQIYNHTSIIIVVALAPSWGGGGEVQMANERGIPVVILRDAVELTQGHLSRFLCGGPSIKEVVGYHTIEEALLLLEDVLVSRLWSPFKRPRQRGNGGGSILEVTRQIGLSR